MEPRHSIGPFLEHFDAELAAGRLPPYLRRALGRFRELTWAEQRAELPALYLSLEEHLADVSPDRRHSRSHLRSILRARFAPLLALPEMALVLAEPEEQERRLGELLLERLRAEAGTLLGGRQETVASSVKETVDELHRAVASARGGLAADRLVNLVLAGLASSYRGLEPVLGELLPDRLLDEERARALAARRRERGWRERFDSLRRVNDELAARVAQLEREKDEREASLGDSSESVALQFGAVLDTAEEGILTVDRHGVVMRMNRAALAMWGYDEAEVVGKDLGLLLPWSPKPGHVETLRHYLETGTPRVFGERLLLEGRRRDGTAFPARVRATETAVGEHAVFMLVVRDLTEIRQAEARLRLQAAALQSSGGGIAITDPLGRIEWANPSFATMTGYASDALVGRSLADIGAVEAGPAHVAKRGEGVLRRQDGSTFVARVVVSPVRDEAERVVHVVVHHDDITAERRALAALERSEASFRALIEQSPEAIFIVRAGAIVFVNAAGAACVGHARRDELVGRPVADIFAPPEREELSASIDAMESRGEPFAQREANLWRADGVAIVADIVGLSLTFDGGPAAVLLARDITERKRLHARLAVADRMVALGTLAAGVAHEINNPLTYVMLNLEAVTEGLRRLNGRADVVGEWGAIEGAIDRLRAQAREALEGADRVRHIVRDLHAFARDEAAGVNYPVDLPRILDTTIQMAWSQIRHRARLVKSYGTTPLVRATDTRLGQVFLNLLLNAVQALPEGEQDRHVIEVRTGTDDRGRAEVEIRDTGAGISRENRHRVFDPFFTTKRLGDGMGLGLSISHNIVTALGGDIDIYSEPGEGTRVRVILPPARPVE